MFILYPYGYATKICFGKVLENNYPFVSQAWCYLTIAKKLTSCCRVLTFLLATPNL